MAIEPPSTIHVDENMLNLIPKGSKILEVACALGRTAFDLESMGFDVTAVDIDPEIVEMAVAKKIESGSNVDFMVADGRYLPFQDESFDCVIMNAFLTMLTDQNSRNRAITEAYRVLNEEGILYVADFLQNRLSPVYMDRYEEGESITGEKGSFKVMEGDELLYWAHHHTEEELDSLILPHFTEIDRERKTFMSFHGNRVQGIIILAMKLGN